MQRKTAKQPLMAVDWWWQRKKIKKIQFTFLVIQPSFCSIYILSIQKTKTFFGGFVQIWKMPASHQPFFQYGENRLSKSTELTGWSGSKAKTKQACKAKINELLLLWPAQTENKFFNNFNFNETIYSQIIFMKSVQYNGIRFHSTCGPLF